MCTNTHAMNTRPYFNRHGFEASMYIPCRVMKLLNMGNIILMLQLLTLLGLRHVFSGSAQNTLDTLIEILDDLDVIRKELGESSVSSLIVSKLKNAMSDRHAAENLFSSVLSDYRAKHSP